MKPIDLFNPFPFISNLDVLHLLDTPVGFHFIVVFELFPQLPSDLAFQEVSGLSVDLETDTYVEGGENRFVHKLPKRTSYSPLVLKRGIASGPGLFRWFRQAIEDFVFEPTNATIMLLNDRHIPIAGWYVVNAYPHSWSVSNFDAEKSELVIETMQLNYNYFKKIRI